MQNFRGKSRNQAQWSVLSSWISLSVCIWYANPTSERIGIRFFSLLTNTLMINYKNLLDHYYHVPVSSLTIMKRAGQYATLNQKNKKKRWNQLTKRSDIWPNTEIRKNNHSANERQFGLQDLRPTALSSLRHTALPERDCVWGFFTHWSMLYPENVNCVFRFLVSCKILQLRENDVDAQDRCYRIYQRIWW